ncbi:hypothetical protein EVAR_275_1 [Eumeta japonica]|uniref:Uncharacterized protein n=1 Tax=Eumeta variegata TaxID=151549 RepID=A0A4C1SCJ7_EUMVA|nr:hypothetical protein EVAR_275_1 [Eumeta japonica]
MTKGDARRARAAAQPAPAHTPDRDARCVRDCCMQFSGLIRSERGAIGNDNGSLKSRDGPASKSGLVSGPD